MEPGTTISKMVSRCHDEQAQGVVEFALILTVVMMLFLGTVDFARFLYYDTAIQDAARIGVEVASNHCDPGANCGLSTSPMTSDYVMQATVCEAQPYVTLQPQISCAPCSTSPCTSPCGGAGGCPAACGQDVCIDPSYPPGNSASVPQPPPDVTVSVGYDFKPISFFLNGGQLPFIGNISLFQEHSCYNTSSGSDDPTVNHHTICASSTGRISTS